PNGRGESAEDIINRMSQTFRANPLNFNNALRQDETGKKPKPEVVAAYVYKDENGTPYLRVQRTSDKQFWQRHWTGSEWAKGKPQGPKIPYRLPELLAAGHGTVFVCEGEKDADALAERGFVATSASEGAGKWTADLNAHFEGKTVYVLADNDDQGEK